MKLEKFQLRGKKTFSAILNINAHCYKNELHCHRGNRFQVKNVWPKSFIKTARWHVVIVIGHRFDSVQYQIIT